MSYGNSVPPGYISIDAQIVYDACEKYFIKLDQDGEYEYASTVKRKELYREEYKVSSWWTKFWFKYPYLEEDKFQEMLGWEKRSIERMIADMKRPYKKIQDAAKVVILNNSSTVMISIDFVNLFQINVDK